MRYRAGLAHRILDTAAVSIASKSIYEPVSSPLSLRW